MRFWNIWRFKLIGWHQHIHVDKKKAPWIIELFCNDGSDLCAMHFVTSVPVNMPVLGQYWHITSCLQEYLFFMIETLYTWFWTTWGFLCVCVKVRMDFVSVLILIYVHQCIDRISNLPRPLCISNIYKTCSISPKYLKLCQPQVGLLLLLMTKV